MKALRYILLVAIAAICGCSGAGTGIPATPGANGFAYDTSALKGAAFLQRAKVASLSVDLVPRMQNAAGLEAYAAAVSNPRSSTYRHFLTPSQIGSDFGADAAQYASAVKYFQSYGLSVATWPQRLLLHVSGPQGSLESALKTKFGWYKNGSSVFVAPMAAPSLPASIGIAGAVGIVMKPTAFTDSTLVTSPGATNGIVYGYSPQQIASAFDYVGAYNAGFTGAGITTGVIGTAGLSAADVPTFKQTFGVHGSGTVTVVSATDANAPGNTALGFAPPLPVTGPICSGGSPYEPIATCNPEDVETQLDTETLASLAYDANLRYYLAYNPNDDCGVIGSNCPPGAGIPLQGLFEFNAELETAIADDSADVLSLSFGGAEAALVGVDFNAGGTGITPLEIAALASEGIAVFVSSGDSGAEACQTFSNAPSPDSLCVSYPATDPNVVSVGGTNTPLNTAGQFVGGITGWGNHTSGGNSGSGGGVSAYFSRPAFQMAAPGVTGSMRNVPDIALDGDDLTGVAVMTYADPTLGGFKRVQPVGGTSVAAPEAAAMWALVLQACKQTSQCATASGPKPYRLGNPNAFFYNIYRSSEYPSVFYDVLYGNNAQLPSCTFTGATPCPAGTLDPGYSAGTGYDLVTGIGVPFARSLIHAVVGI